MINDHVLDLAVIVVSCVFVALTIASLKVAGTVSSGTVRRLILATRLAWCAFAAALANLIINAAEIPDDGPIWTLLWAVTSICSAFTAVSTSRRRQIKSDLDRLRADLDQALTAHGITVDRVMADGWQRAADELEGGA